MSEAIALRVADIDADRMTIRIEAGKGAKDRYVPLAARLLQDLRAYWTTTPSGVWLFANRQGTRPIDITVAQKIYTMAKRRAGIQKQGGIHALRHAFSLTEAISREKHGVGSISGANTGEPYAGNFVALPRNLFPKNFGAPDLASKFPRGPRPYLHPYSVI